LSSDERLITICVPHYGRLHDQMVPNKKFSSELIEPMIEKILYPIHEHDFRMVRFFGLDSRQSSQQSTF